MRLVTLLIVACSLTLAMPVALASRIKDITSLAGVRDNQLVGYGLVVGLDGTGDQVNRTPFTQQTFKNMLLQFGIRLPNGVNLQLQNVAAVAISANLPPFAKVGQKVDITVSSLGNSISLRGGQLLMSPLRGADGQVYAVSQGAVVVSGFGAQGNDGSKLSVNSTSTGSIPNGATVEKIIDMPFVQNGEITFQLNDPDFTTAQRIAQAVNTEFKRKVAHALDARAIAISVNDLPLDPTDTPTYLNEGSPTFRSVGYKGETSAEEDADLLEKSAEKRASQAQRMMGRFVPLISRIENITLDPAAGRARVVVNSRTGTIVVGKDVIISPVAVAHGNLSVVVSERPFVSQPNAFANGHTVKGTASDITASQTSNRAFVLSTGTSLNDLVSAINAVGAAPGDLIAILEAVKAAGALHADLEVI
ncbi:MAG: flagellar basal body P-ring protein FlgI [Gammaproteobacteria bacterium]